MYAHVNVYTETARWPKPQNGTWQTCRTSAMRKRQNSKRAKRETENGKSATNKQTNKTRTSCRIPKRMG